MLRLFCLGLIVLAVAWAGVARAQEEAAEAASEEEVAPEEVALLPPEEVEALVAPIAFYPDEVLAVTLPAATYPLDIVEASRFLEKQQTAPDAQPSPDWDPSVLALLNYPVVLNMMNEDLDWTTSLGEAVINQQADVIDAIQQVRRSAYTAGHLKSDDKTTISFENDVVTITPADPKVVYVPIYETVAAPAPEPIAEPAPEPTFNEAAAPVEGTTTESSTGVTNVTNVYYPSNVAYSEPYTPYYDSTASFWTGALVGGITMGFLMDWDDDDIDIDIDEGDFDDWSPGRSADDININGDVNIGNDVAIGKGDSWRKMREQRTGGETASQLKSTRTAKKSAQPVASLHKRPQASTQRTAAASNLKKPAQVAKPKTQVRKPQKAVSRQQPKQKASALGNVERGQSTVKASKRGAGSQQKAVKQMPSKQQVRPTQKPRPTGTSARPRQGGQSAFGNMSGGRQTKQFSNRGAGSQQVRRRR